MEMKVLSPAGEFESLKTAIYNGADEVYLGVKDFNARNIEGFNMQSLKKAVEFAHVYGVKVLLAVNILFKDDELQSAVDLIVDANNIGIDAFIIQDIGLANFVHYNYPNIVMHASTQMAVHNLAGAKEIEKMGFSRVVLARETSLEEIKSIKENTTLEIEYFVLGALCVSFSGNCYMSSYLFDASGNRGKCKQLCRLPYDLRLNNKVLKHGYLLSAKDFNMLDRIEDLKSVGVDCLKIEGRARRPYYVGVATRLVREAVDKIDFDKKDLLLAFNRGYTEGYLNGNGNIISDIQNHKGIEIGSVLKFKKGNRFNVVVFSSSVEISPKSSLKFFRAKQEVATISAFDLTKTKTGYELTTKTMVEPGDIVCLISDYKKETEMSLKVKKVEVDISVYAYAGKRIKAKVLAGNYSCEVEGEMLQKAQTAPLSEDEILKNFLKSEYFTPNLHVFMDKCFINKKFLNDFRRSVYEKLFMYKTENTNNIINKTNVVVNAKTHQLQNFQVVEKKDDDLFENIIIYSPEQYIEDDILNFKKHVECLNKIFVLELPNFALSCDVNFLRNLVEKNKISILVNNLYALGFNTKKYIGAGMNVFNSLTANYFALPYIKAEGIEEKTMPYMTLRHCPMKNHLGANCLSCPYQEGYEYVMDSGKRFKLKRKKLSTCTFYLS